MGEAIPRSSSILQAQLHLTIFRALGLGTWKPAQYLWPLCSPGQSPSTDPWGLSKTSLEAQKNTASNFF